MVKPLLIPALTISLGSWTLDSVFGRSTKCLWEGLCSFALQGGILHIRDFQLLLAVSHQALGTNFKVITNAITARVNQNIQFIIIWRLNFYQAIISLSYGMRTLTYRLPFSANADPHCKLPLHLGCRHYFSTMS